jgi:hypothetical protein
LGSLVGIFPINSRMTCLLIRSMSRAYALAI